MKVLKGNTEKDVLTLITTLSSLTPQQFISLRLYQAAHLDFLVRIPEKLVHLSSYLLLTQGSLSNFFKLLLQRSVIRPGLLESTTHTYTDRGCLWSSTVIICRQRHVVRFHSLLVIILDVFLHSGYVGHCRLDTGVWFGQCALATIYLQLASLACIRISFNNWKPDYRLDCFWHSLSTYSSSLAKGLWVADLILQRTAVILLLLKILLQLYCMLLGYRHLPLNFQVVVPLIIQQVPPLFKGGIPFADSLVSFGKMLNGWRNKKVKFNTQAYCSVSRG